MRRLLTSLLIFYTALFVYAEDSLQVVQLDYATFAIQKQTKHGQEYYLTNFADGEHPHHEFFKILSAYSSQLEFSNQYADFCDSLLTLLPESYLRHVRFNLLLNRDGRIGNAYFTIDNTQPALSQQQLTQLHSFLKAYRFPPFLWKRGYEMMDANAYYLFSIPFAKLKRYENATH